MSPRWTNPMLSVDVVTLRPAAPASPAEPPAPGKPVVCLGLGARMYEPHLGELALPGVLMRAGETVHEAARRAVAGKLGIDENHLRLVRTGRVYDTPSRDERGPTVSIGCLAVVDPGVTGTADWVGLDEVPALPFDHNEIVRSSLPQLYELIWSDPAALRALLGDVFTAPAMATLEAALTGRTRDVNNVRRDLDAMPFLQRAESVAHGRGRPAARWAIRRAH